MADFAAAGFLAEGLEAFAAGFLADFLAAIIRVGGWEREALREERKGRGNRPRQWAVNVGGVVVRRMSLQVLRKRVASVSENRRAGRRVMLSFNLGHNFRVSFEVAVELFQCLKGFGTDVMFHAFDIVGDDRFAEAEKL